jgi:Rrf2 family transcriptional regulator, nitric oxide-sensitive transcriptional repressor
MDSELDLPGWSKAADPLVSELQSITNEIDTVSKAILDTVTLATALKSTKLRTELTAQRNGALKKAS